ncbi:alpha/beta hydrolase [Streptomyces phaeolivaceus]|uniref:Alpha/beta hydrolase n=1 Tax=Streptomyces phaeolivaceus TaxID=2653200 RepID=A0A5P8K6M0_9ACTN|nr:alpha/beta hydrolase [Streptomyces phaeolivaceus]QFQ98189.1 alpha/beta hydrolase [Streptomyces phaeolivaceus]
MECMVRVEGGEVWADDTGVVPGPGAEGPPLVLLHPGVGDSRIWDRVVSGGLDARYRVIRYDARGFGRSPKPGTSYTQTRDLRAVLDHFGVPRAVLVGSSMGGSTAIGFTLEEPARVAALGLVVPGVSGYPGLDSAELTERIGQLAKAGDMDGLVALALGMWGAAGPSPDTEAEEALRAAIPAWFTTYGHDTPPPPAFDRLGEIALPTALLLGEKDQPEVVRSNEEIASRIPGCHLVRLPSCDHFPTLRDPDAVREFIEELYERAG